MKKMHSYNQNNVSKIEDSTSLKPRDHGLWVVPLSCLLAVFFALGCSKSQGESAAPKKEATQPATPSTAPEPEAKKPGPSPAAKFEGPGALLPREVSDFSLVADPRYFGPDNLYDLINGGAEIYTEFGLKKMVTADYRSSKRESLSVTLEIYDQGSLLGAFGRMARFLKERVDPGNAGQGLPKELEQQGIFGSTDVIFYKDNYLVHLTLLDETPTATMESMKEAGLQILPHFISAVSGKIPQNPPLPAELTLFPDEHKVTRSEQWEPKNLVGIPGMGPGVSCRYKTAEASWQLFATEKLEDPTPLLKRLKQENSEPIKAGRLSLNTVSNRVVGFTASGESWTQKDTAAAQNALKAYKRALP